MARGLTTRSLIASPAISSSRTAETVNARGDDELDTPTWMHQVIESRLTDRLRSNAGRRGQSLRDANASTDPRAEVFIEVARDTAQQARNR
jgi:hypothetical protein